MRNKCVKLTRQTKKEYFRNLDIKFVSDNKRFWTTIKPNFNNNNLKQNKIILIEDDKIISNSKDIAQIMNNYFINITDSLNLPKTDPLTTTTCSHQGNDCQNDDEVLRIIEKYKNHSSIKIIKKNNQRTTW